MGEIQETPYDNGKTSFDISFHSSHICVQFEADILEKLMHKHFAKNFSEKCLI